MPYSAFYRGVLETCASLLPADAISSPFSENEGRLNPQQYGIECLVTGLAVVPFDSGDSSSKA